MKIMVNGQEMEIREKAMLNGKEVAMNNYGDKSCPNKFMVSAPAWKDLSTQQQRDIQVRAMLNGLTISSAGFEYAITTLTQIKAKAIRQTFYEVAPSDFMPVVVGEGAYMTNLVYNNVYSNHDDFESGFMDSAMPFGKVPTGSAKIIAKPVPIVNWNKGMNYNIFQLEQASRGNVDLVSELEFGRKKNWDLGVQRVAFLGAKSRPDILGLYNGESVTPNTSLITATLSSLSADNFQLFVSGLIKEYLANVNGTVMPDTFIIPQSDWVGLGGAASSSYPVTSKLEYMEKAFKLITSNNNFKITNTQYGNKALMNTIGSNHDRYVLYRNTPETLEFNIPMPYTTTTFGTANGYDFENVAMGQISGVYIKHPQEVMYFDNMNS